MQKISELFGLYCGDDSLDFRIAVKNQICPFTQRICTKMRKSNPIMKIGTCSVKYQNQDIIICPSRFLDRSVIFKDCLHLLTLHEPKNKLYLIPEVKIPGGHVDYFLVSVKNKEIIDFVGIEIQTMDTTGAVWPDRQMFLKENGFDIKEEDIFRKKPYGMNWKMTLKTILLQMHHKSKTFENLNKHLVLIIQEPLYMHMKKDFDFSKINSSSINDPVHIHSYSFSPENRENSFILTSSVSTNAEGIENCLHSNNNILIELNDIMLSIEQKLSDNNLLNV